MGLDTFGINTDSIINWIIKGFITISFVYIQEIKHDVNNIKEKVINNTISIKLLSNELQQDTTTIKAK